jgi:hypothetical protein
MASLGIAPPDVKDVTLSLFGGRKTDIAPSDLPEGLTPDEQDGLYLPGQWQSRPGLGRLYAAGVLTPGTSVLYEKTYIQPGDLPFTLILTSDGKLWQEDVSKGTAPTVIAAATITPGLYTQSVTEFGREYIAFSDLLHGQGVPLQYDGTNLDRVTMDGPGAPPTVADLAPPKFNIAGANGTQLLNQSLVLASASEQGTTVSYSCVSNTIGIGGSQIPLAEFIQPGDQIQVAGFGTAGYNGIFPVISVSGNVIQVYNPTTGLAPVLGGAGCTLLVFFVFVTFAAGFNASTTQFQQGSQVIIAGNSVPFYNSTWTLRASPPAPPAGTGNLFLGPSIFAVPGIGTGGTVQEPGQIAPGQHQVVVMWLTRQGYISKPSPAASWFAAGGNLVRVTNIPTGPSNVVARIIGFTGAGGDNFFIIPAAVTLPNPNGPPILIGSTIVPDNVSTAATFNFSDNTLFAATAIDQIGNDLFDQVVLGPVLGFFAYASRLVAWGDYNKVENFLGMGFEGGFGGTGIPLPWSLTAGIGTAAAGGAWPNGFCWQISGNGIVGAQGQLSQPAYQDSFGAAILSPSTRYMVRAWLDGSGAGGQQVVFEFFSPTQGQISFVTLLAPATGAFVTGSFNNPTPASIPSDTVLRFYSVSLPIGSSVKIDEVEIIFAENPYRDNLSRWSYVNNPEAFAETTGELGPDDDDTPIRCFALLRQSSLLETADGVHIFQDNTGEPYTWNVNQLTRAIGAVSVKAGDPGKFGTGDAAEDWALVAGKNGVYLFAGAEFWKVSQEISRNPGQTQAQDPRACWDDINWAAQQTIVAKNDPASRRAYFAVPLNGATTPNKIFVLDYREMDTATQIASAAPLHITLQGKMRSSDLTRKWSVWNVAANDIEVLIRPGNQRTLGFAGGLNSQGLAFGNLYTLDPGKLTDDDYGAFTPYYTTYFFTDHETEQALGIGSDIHLARRLHGFIAGVGLVYITPIVDSLYNFQPPLSPRVLTKDTDGSNFLKSDLEWTMVGIRGQRIAFRISVAPLPGSTDVQLRLQKFVVGMMKDPVVAVRQSAV